MENFKKFCYSADDVELFSVFFHNYNDKIKCRKLLEKLGGLRIVEGAEYNLEIVNINAGKGNALKQLSEMLHIDCSETISIGDSDNDSSIAQIAGLGLAVSNASDSLKAISDNIICSNEEHAVLYVLTNFLNN